MDCLFETLAQATKPNYAPIGFTRTIGELQGDCNNHGDCFHYGSFAGCDSGCPQLRRGECENAEENKEIIQADDELTEIYKLKAGK